MPELAQSDAAVSLVPAAPGSSASFRTALWLSGITLVWKVGEVSVSAYAAITAHSPAMLAFGSDTVVEMISAVVVLSQWSSGKRISEHRAARIAGILLLLLAAVVTAAALGSFALHIRPDTSPSGIGITAASLLAMPVLARWKRTEALRLRNGALAADAIQSATCAYLALLTLAGLGLNAIFGIAWFDNLAALLALPLLVREARRAWNGHFCSHCYTSPAGIQAGKL